MLYRLIDEMWGDGGVAEMVTVRSIIAQFHTRMAKSDSFARIGTKAMGTGIDPAEQDAPQNGRGGYIEL